MVGKLISVARTREIARMKMVRALDEFIVTGVRTTIPFHRYVFSHQLLSAADSTPDLSRSTSTTAVWKS